MRCELEVGDSHNFPPIPLPEWCNFFSQALSVARNTGKEGVSEKVLLPISPGILSHRFTVSWSCQGPPIQQISTTESHPCSLELNSHASIQPPWHCIDYTDFSQVSSGIHVTRWVLGLSGRESRPVYLAPHFVSDPPGQQAFQAPQATVPEIHSRHIFQIWSALLGRRWAC